MCPLCHLALANSPQGHAMAGAMNAGILFLMAAPYLLVLAFLAAFTFGGWRSLARMRKNFSSAMASLPPNPPKGKMVTPMLFGLTGFMILLSAVTGVWGVVGKRASSDLPVYATVGHFALTGQDGNPFGSGNLAGKIWIADFIYTRCHDECPILTARMSELRQSLNGSGVEFVSFTVDPLHDSPAELSRYAARFGAGGDWHFVTGSEKSLTGLMTQSFHLPVNPPQGGSGEILHAEKFVLVDASGRVRGYYDGNDPDSLKTLARHVKSLERSR